jgi:hypothetical protein
MATIDNGDLISRVVVKTGSGTSSICAFQRPLLSLAHSVKARR